MFAHLFLAAAMQAAPTTVMDDFKTLCLATKGETAAVTAAATAQGGWGEPGQQSGMTAWSHPTDGGGQRILAAGEQGAADAVRQACMVVTRPAQADLAASLASQLGGVTQPIEGNAGLFAHAASAQAYRAGDVTFIGVTSDADSTTLTAIRRK